MSGGKVAIYLEMEETATCLFLHKFNGFLVKDISNFVDLFQALNASYEIKMYVPFPFMVRI